MSVEWVWAGAGTDTGVWVRGKVTGSSTRLAVDTDPAFSAPVFFGPVAPTAQGVVSIEASGLDPDTRFHYALEDDSVLDTGFSGQFRTHPTVGEIASFTIGAAGDAGLTGAGDDSFITSGVSNNPVFDTMRQRALDEEWSQFIHLGDLYYRDLVTADPNDYRDAYHDTLTFNDTLGADARQGAFFRSTQMAYVWDDHDYSDNNSDGTYANKDVAADVYREIVPHYTLPDADGAIYQAWQIGRVQFIASDTRFHRDPNTGVDDGSKTMLGEAQKRWMEGVLRNSTAQALVWVLPSLWLSDQGDIRNVGIALSGADYSNDAFGRFRSERAELVQMLGDFGWLDRMIALQADKHALSISSGPNNAYGGFPLFMFAGMDSGFSLLPEGQYDIGQSTGRQRYGTLRVEDSGHTIALHATGYINNTVWRTYTGYAYVEPHVLALDYSAGQTFDPFEPTDDDQRIANDFIASRVDGGEVRQEQTTGPLSTQDPPDGVGRYAGSETYNVPSDDDLDDQAGWQVYTGTIDQMRWPALGQNLTNPRMEDLRRDIIRTEVGDRIDIDNPPEWLPPKTIGAIVEGYEERLSTHEWTIEYNASPAEAATVGEVAPRLVLNSNHDFEVSAFGWEEIGASSFSRSTEQAFRGQASGRVVPDGVTAVVRMHTRLADSPRVFAGVEYQFSAWVFSETGHDIDMSVQWFDADGNEISFPFIVPATTLPVEEWTQLVGSAVAPEDAHRVRWHINERPTPAATDIYFVDEALMTQVGVDPEPDQSDRFDTSESELQETIDATGTELLIRTVQDETTGARWINSAGPTITHEFEFPFDLRLGGEVVRATAAEPVAWDGFRRPDETGTWGTSDQGTQWLDTAVADTNLGSSESAQYGFIQLTGATTDIRAQLLDLDFDVTDAEILWSVRTNQTSAGASQLPSLLLRDEGGTDFYRSRLHLRTDDTVSLSVTRGTSQIGASVNLPLLTYTPSTDLDERIWVRTRIIGNRILARAWRQDLPSGAGISLDLRYLEPPHWQIDREVTTDTIAAGRVGFSASTFAGYSGTNPSMRFQMLSVETPQRFTVTRSINGVEKSHSAGTAISLDREAVVGL